MCCSGMGRPAPTPETPTTLWTCVHPCHAPSSIARTCLQAEFRKIDRGGTGTMDAAGLTVLFSKVLRVQLTAEQAEAVVSLCDTTGDRRVPLNMFMSLCAHPDLELGHPNVAHLQQQVCPRRILLGHCAKGSPLLILRRGVCRHTHTHTHTHTCARCTY